MNISLCSYYQVFICLYRLLPCTYYNLFILSISRIYYPHLNHRTAAHATRRVAAFLHLLRAPRTHALLPLCRLSLTHYTIGTTFMQDTPLPQLVDPTCPTSHPTPHLPPFHTHHTFTTTPHILHTFPTFEPFACWGGGRAHCRRSLRLPPHSHALPFVCRLCRLAHDRSFVPSPASRILNAWYDTAFLYFVTPQTNILQAATLTALPYADYNTALTARLGA